MTEGDARLLREVSRLKDLWMMRTLVLQQWLEHQGLKAETKEIIGCDDKGQLYAILEAGWQIPTSEPIPIQTLLKEHLPCEEMDSQNTLKATPILTYRPHPAAPAGSPSPSTPDPSG